MRRASLRTEFRYGLIDPFLVHDRMTVGQMKVVHRHMSALLKRRERSSVSLSPNAGGKAMMPQITIRSLRCRCDSRLWNWPWSPFRVKSCPDQSETPLPFCPEQGTLLRPPNWTGSRTLAHLLYLINNL
jgi:hypothetical protein